MAQVSAAEAKDQWASLLSRAEAGETVIVTRYGEPVAELRPANLDAPRQPRSFTRETAAWRREELKNMPKYDGNPVDIISELRDAPEW
jgi:prevent-host-death family protein